MDERDQRRLVDEAREAGVQRLTVGLVIREGSALLVLLRRPDDFLPSVWEVPGGHLEPGETIAEAAARELEEETGWQLRGLGTLINWFDYPGEEGDLTREWNFEVTVDRHRPLVHAEHRDARWVTRSTYRELPMTDDMRRLVAAALETAPGGDAEPHQSRWGGSTT